jgi:predicted nucleic acid-binding protein
VFYLDSSALAKRYLSEQGSAWVSALCDPEAGATILIAEVTRVEVAAAIASRHRANSMTQEDRDRLVGLLLHHCDTEYTLVPISHQVLGAAVRLTQRHRLRGYDAVQLAAALDANRAAISADLPALTFISADDDLNAAARAEGLVADNPNQHP